MGSELENITNVIQELDNQTKELKHFSGVLKKIDNLSNTVENLIITTKENSKEYENILLQLEKRKQDLDNEMKDVISIAKQTNENIEKRFNILEDNFRKSIDEVSKNMNIDEKIKSILLGIDERNKVLTSKLEDNQHLLIDELNKLREQVNKKKGIIF
jgi:ABC-type transporter Mla subunit MlaD